MVEPELLAPYAGPREITDNGLDWNGRYVVCMHSADGKLLNLEEYPLLRTRLETFRSRLELRAIVRNGAPWYRPIDRVRRIDWSRPEAVSTRDN